MFCPIPGRRNALSYLLWRWLLQKSGEFQARLDRYFFGQYHGLNDYDRLAFGYQRSNTKPDKLYSILPTVLALAGKCKDKVVLDLGCGAGFFTSAFAELGPSKVFGVDNSPGQLGLASQHASHPKITYFLGDLFADPLPTADIVIAPFVANYARSRPILEHFFNRLYGNLSNGGKIVLVVDMPDGKKLERFGAMKSLSLPQDEARIEIILFREGRQLCQLTAVYYTPVTIVASLEKVGFHNIMWHKPIISPEGIAAFGEEFWRGYTDTPELGYLTAEK